MTTSSSLSPHVTFPIPDDVLALLQLFDYMELGDGNPVAGMNVLTSMCCTLAAVAGPEAGMISPEGLPHSVGLSWIAAGPLTPDLIDAKVLDPLSKLQNNLSEHIQLYAEARDSGRTVHTINGPRNLKGQTIRAMEAETLQRELIDSGGTLRTIAGKLLLPPALNDDSSVLERPGIYFAGIDPKDARSLLSTAHLRHPFVSFAVDSAPACSRIAGTAQMVVDGYTAKGSLPRRTKGFVLGLLRNVVLEECHADGHASLEWLRRMLWLADDDVQMLGTPTQSDRKHVRLGHINERFSLALRQVLESRIRGAARHTFEMAKSTQNFVNTLSSRGQAFSNLSGTLRNLPATLCFGLFKLVSAAEHPPGFSLPPVMPLAFHLAFRMVYLSRRAIETTKREDRQMLSQSILAKLSEGPHTERRLTQRHHRLPIADCREALARLESAGLVKRIGNEWEAVLPASPAISQPRTVDVS